MFLFLTAEFFFRIVEKGQAIRLFICTYHDSSVHLRSEHTIISRISTVIPRNGLSYQRRAGYST
uniref:Uncharacterized protein n=1 Tax=Romanomermis culicivorax TaxID=13658 RepID=A0A915HHR8_ROMCU